MKYRIILTAITCSVLAGCATPYQQMGLVGGVQASRIDETTVQISARGNAFTDVDTITRYALRKAAEETVADGFDGFYVVSDQDRSRHGTIYTGGGSTTNFTGMATGVGNTAFITGTATTDYTPPQAYNFIKPGESVTIRMFRGPKPSNVAGVYDAHELLRYMAPLQQANSRPEPVMAAPVNYQTPASPIAAPPQQMNSSRLEAALRQIATGSKVPMHIGQGQVVSKVEAIGTELRLTANLSGEAYATDQQYSSMASQICSLEPQYQILRAGASVRVVYLSATGQNVGSIVMTKRECGL